MVEETVPKIPDLQLAQLRFTLAHAANPEEKSQAQSKLMEAIQTHNMAPLYTLLAEEFHWKVDAKLLAKWKAANDEALKALDDKLEDAEKNFGETEVWEALLAKAEYLAKICDKDRALTAYRVAYEKAVGVGARLDVVFAQLRIGMFFNDQDLTQRNIEKARTLIDEGGDWDRRNRLKVYEGLFKLSLRDFKTGSKLLLEALATFTSTELMDYKEFVKYTCLSAALAVDRSEFKKKVLDAPEILEVIHEIPHMETYIQALYNCRYAEFFTSLAQMEEYLKKDRYLNAHYRWYTREMRILGYSQLLESYRSVTMDSMAKSFGVSQAFIDRDVSKFIASGRLNCIIDKVGGIIETNRPDSKNAQYQSIIKQGDLLLNRVQKLSSVINV